MMSRELRLRIISAVLLAIPVLLITWAGGIWFRGLSALLGLLIYYEFSTITGLATREPAERIVGAPARDPPPPRPPVPDLLEGIWWWET